MQKFLIHYFSGTGNTYHMVTNLKKQLINSGSQAVLLNIENNTAIAFKDYDFHIFCFPVYGFGTPSIMLRYISNLTLNNGCKAAIICTSAGIEGQALTHTKHLLTKKGIKVIISDMVVYTYNFTQVLNPQSKEKEKTIFKKAESKISTISTKIINSDISLKRTNIAVNLFSWIIFIVFSNFARRILGKTFIADSSCTGCGKCKNLCPAKAISINSGRPSWNYSCETCQRCINMCPNKSIQLSIAKLLIFIVAELIPILIILDINNFILPLPKLLNILIFFMMFIINTFIAAALIGIMEKFSFFRLLFSISYTKKYRRNVASGFKLR